MNTTKPNKMILVSFFSELLSDEIKICYIFEYQSNVNWAFRFFGDTQYIAREAWAFPTIPQELSMTSREECQATPTVLYLEEGAAHQFTNKVIPLGI